MAVNLKHYEIDPSELRKILETKAGLLVDVREENEVEEGFISHAFLCPLSRLTQLHEMHLNPSIAMQLPLQDSPLYLYCASGRRVLKAAEYLTPYYSEIYPIRWGYKELLSFGLKASLPVKEDPFPYF